MYFSEAQVSGKNASIHANLMTSFSIRNQADNTQLTKSEFVKLDNIIPELPSNPEFSEEYRKLKKGEMKHLNLAETEFQIHDKVLFEYTYKLNPYYDLNGVGLLYFASFPIINDVGEAAYFNQKNKDDRWELTYFTLSRDIFFFANCNINDEVIYKLNGYENTANSTLKLSSSLYRKSDHTLLARIFTLKKGKK
jgi:probable biosynthetic protein (TIGR04098 family)